jgi:hypothetical protein
MAFVRLPDLAVSRSGQRYEHLRANDDGSGVLRYSSGKFSAEVTIGADGFVLDYPEIARRV